MSIKIIVFRRNGGRSHYLAENIDQELAAFMAEFCIWDKHYYAPHYSDVDLDSEPVLAVIPDNPNDDPDLAKYITKTKLRNAARQRNHDQFLENARLYRKAKGGNAKAARALLWRRSDYEYEGFDYECALDATKNNE